MALAELDRARQDALAAWLPQQRWYAAKGEAIGGVQQIDAAGPLEIIRVTTAAGKADYLLSAVEEEGARAQWLNLLARGARLEGAHGAVAFEPLAALEGAGASRPLGAEQSNTSILYLDGAGAPHWVMKLFRRLQAGENPEFELPRALSAAGFAQVAAPLGRAVYQPADGEAVTLAVLGPFIANQGDGWEYVLRELRAGATLERELRQLGRRTLELHQALGGLAGDAFAAEPVTAADVARWRERARSALDASELAPYQDLLRPWRKALNTTAATGLATGLNKTRIHGDYHLGQTLRTQNDFVIFDFEGEPVRPIAERRRKGSALQDVAGMLRSLDYAAAMAPAPAGWHERARTAFLTGYGAVAAPELLRFFELEKAVYELSYELRHRPAWVEVPRSYLERTLG
ncbi:MAG: maltokinase N-terminal cap-like domain-containing protein [Terriglobales bacterium]